MAAPSAGGAVIVLPSESVWSALFTTVGALAGVCASSSLLSTQPVARPSAATTATSERAAHSLRTIAHPRSDDRNPARAYGAEDEKQRDEEPDSRGSLRPGVGLGRAAALP